MRKQFDLHTAHLNGLLYCVYSSMSMQSGIKSKLFFIFNFFLLFFFILNLCFIFRCFLFLIFSFFSDEFFYFSLFIFWEGGGGKK